VPIVYATFQDMRDRFRDSALVQLADADDIAGAQAYVTQKIAKAGVIIDGFVSAKYGDRSGLPVPALLIEIACDIAFHECFNTEPTERAIKAKADAIAMLRDIAAGKMKIDEGVIDAQPTRPGAVLVEGEAKIFGRSNMKGF
jgi:phage gp36-like protein